MSGGHSLRSGTAGPGQEWGVEVVGWGCWKAGSLAEVELLLSLWHAAHQGGLGQCDLVGLEWKRVGFLSPAEWERVGEWERVFSLEANHPG